VIEVPLKLALLKLPSVKLNEMALAVVKLPVKLGVTKASSVALFL
jgi:hypothetical protein